MNDANDSPLNTSAQAASQYARSLIEASLDPLVTISAQGKITDVNKATEQVTGANRDKLIGSDFADYFTDPEKAREGYKQVFSQGSVTDYPLAIRHVSGEITDVLYNANLYRDAKGNVLGVFAAARDITERKKAEEATQAASQYARSLIEASLDPLVTISAEGKVTDVNIATEQVTGVCREILVGSDFADYFTDPQKAREGYQQVFLKGSVTDYPLAIRHASGKITDVVYNASVYRDTRGNVLGVFAAARDITERKRSEEDRERLVARLQQEDQRKDEFLATLAHELRNPLAPIRNGLQIMRLAPGDAAANERIRSMMERQLRQMVHLIDDLLDLSRISRGKIDLRKERIELATAIQQAIEASRPAIAQADHELMIKFPPGPIHVDADLTRLAQVFSNLLNNAAKFTDRGGQIRLSIQQLSAEAVVSIQDNGSGIPTHMLPHVFEMFTRVESNLERSQGGLGIGLSIVKRLVQMHGGSVEARSEGQGRGSEFVVRLPLALSFAGDEPTVQTDPVVPITRHRILVVDDNVDAADSLSLLLEMLGNEVITSYDGESGIQAARKFRPGILLCDIGMPKMNGYDTACSIRAEEWGKNTVMVALTGYGQKDDLQRSADAGFDHHLVKPLDVDDLSALLAGLQPPPA